LNLLLDVIARGGDQSIGYVYASCMAVGLIFGAICDNQHFQRVVRAGASPPAPQPCSNNCHNAEKVLMWYTVRLMA